MSGRPFEPMYPYALEPGTHGFVRGQAVRITTGQFAGRSGYFERYSDVSASCYVRLTGEAKPRKFKESEVL